MASTKQNGLYYKEWLPLNGMASTKRNGFQQTEWLPLKGMASTKMKGFHKTEWLLLKGMVCTVRNAQIYSTFQLTLFASSQKGKRYMSHTTLNDFLCVFNLIASSSTVT